MYGERREGDTGREAYGVSFFADCVDRVCAGSVKIHQHGFGYIRIMRERILWKRLQGVGEGIGWGTVY